MKCTRGKIYSIQQTNIAYGQHYRRYNQDDTVIFDSGSVPDINDEVEPLYDLAAMNTPRYTRHN